MSKITVHNGVRSGDVNKPIEFTVALSLLGGFSFTEVGGDLLTVGVINDGEVLKRVGTGLVSTPSGGGGISGGGTSGKLAKFTGATAVGDSVVTEASGGITVTQPTVGSDVLTLKSTAANDDPTQRTLQTRTLTTDDTTAVTMVSLPINDSSAYLIKVDAVGRQTGGAGGTVGNIATLIRVFGVKRLGGVVSVVGTTAVFDLFEGATTTGITATPSGANLLIQITGADPNANYVWHSTITVQNVST